jgi:hypothetical protein
MKQARKARGGVSRRERAKRCGRNIVGRGMPGELWTPRVDVVMRDANPKGGARTRERFMRLTARWNSEGERSAREDALASQGASYGVGGRPPRSVGNDEASVRDLGNPTAQVHRHKQHSAAQSTPREAVASSVTSAWLGAGIWNLRRGSISSGWLEWNCRHTNGSGRRKPLRAFGVFGALRRGCHDEPRGDSTSA